jgi:hypothetical protein
MGETISFAIATRGPSRRVRALLELVRPHVDEVVLAVDRSGNVDVLEECLALADRRLTFDFEGSPARLLGWLQNQCSADWILYLDDDEIPSPALLDALPDLAQQRRPVRFALRRRWLFPDAARYLCSQPWGTDFQPRLVRNLPGAWSFDGRVHTVVEVQGEQRLTDLALYHADLLISPREARWEKSAAYEDERPGLAIGHFSVNAMYLPESVGGLAPAPVPASDLGAIASVLGAPDSTGGRAGPADGPARSSNGQVAAPAIARRADPNGRTPVEHSDFRSVDVFNRHRHSWDADYDGTVALARAVQPMVAGCLRHLVLAVTNRGSEPWPRADPSEGAVRVEYRWHSGYALGGWAPFLETVWPGQSSRTLVAVRAPLEPGTHVLELGVFRGGRPVGTPLRVPVGVGPNDGRADELTLSALAAALAAARAASQEAERLERS